MELFSLKGKIALVTGAAHGIGFSMAAALAEAGARIAFNSSNEPSMKRGVEEYKKLGIDAMGFVCDVRDEKGVKEMVAPSRRRWEIDILVNNAASLNASLPWIWPWRSSKR